MTKTDIISGFLLEPKDDLTKVTLRGSEGTQAVLIEMTL